MTAEEVAEEAPDKDSAGCYNCGHNNFMYIMGDYKCERCGDPYDYFGDGEND